MTRALCFLALLLLSSCGYTADDYWDMAKVGVARTLCNVANKGANNVDCAAKETVRQY